MSKYTYANSSKRKSSRTFIVVVTLIILLGVAGLFFLYQQQQTVDNYSVDDFKDQPLLGSQSAKVNIVEFGDFLCPSCKAWKEQVFPQLDKDYIQSGTANFRHVNVLFHGDSSVASSLIAEAVYRAEPTKYWQLHNALYEAIDHTTFSQDTLISVVQSIPGLIESEKYQAELGGEASKAALQVDQDLLKKYGVNQTPTIFVNGIRLNNPFDYAEVKKAIADAIEE